MPNDTFNLESDYIDPVVVNFYSYVTYTCQEGYSFEDDYDLPYLRSMCNDDGSWTPIEFKKCVDPTGKSGSLAYEAQFVVAEPVVIIHSVCE